MDERSILREKKLKYSYFIRDYFISVMCVFIYVYISVFEHMMESKTEELYINYTSIWKRY